MLRKILQPFYTAYVLLLFSVSVIAAFPFFVAISLLRNRQGRLIMWLIIHHWSQLFLWLTGMPVKHLGKYPSGNKYVIVANHISYLDPVVIFGALPRHFRPLAKQELSRILIFGFIYRQMAVMVDRSNVQSRARSMRLMTYTIKRECPVLIYPEGTFNETDEPMKSFYDGAFRLALATGVPILPVLLPDTVHRWHYSAWWKIWPGRNRVAYLQPIDVSEYSVHDIELLKQKVHDLMSAEMMRLKKHLI